MRVFIVFLHRSETGPTAHKNVTGSHEVCSKLLMGRFIIK